MFISELHIQGYKRLRDVKLPLGPLTVLIGPNASGKSSIVEAIGLLAESANRRLNQRLAQLGGLSFVRSAGLEDGALSFGLVVPVSDRVTRAYGLALRPSGFGYEIANEELSVDAPEAKGLLEVVVVPGERSYFDVGHGTPVPADFQWDPGETALSQVPPALEVTEGFRRVLGGAQAFRPVDTAARAPIRQQQSLAPVNALSADGGNLLAALQQKRALDRDMFDALEATLKVAYPGFEHLDWPAIAEGQAVLLWRERGRGIWSSQLSDGTLRFLFLSVLLMASTAPPLVMIDEPEVSLHPELIKILTDLLDDASHRTQVLVATQSPELISWLKPEQVVVLDLDEEGWTKATPATELDLDEWLKRYTLGELWVQGTLGGRP